MPQHGWAVRMRVCNACVHTNVHIRTQEAAACSPLLMAWLFGHQFPRTPIKHGHQAGQLSCLPTPCPAQPNLTSRVGQLQPQMRAEHTTVPTEEPQCSSPVSGMYSLGSKPSSVSYSYKTSASHFPSLGLSFPLYKLWMSIYPTLKHCYQDERT